MPLYHSKISTCVFSFYTPVIMDHAGLKLKLCFKSRFKINFFMLSRVQHRHCVHIYLSSIYRGAVFWSNIYACTGLIYFLIKFYRWRHKFRTKLGQILNYINTRFYHGLAVTHFSSLIVAASLKFVLVI